MSARAAAKQAVQFAANAPSRPHRDVIEAEGEVVSAYGSDLFHVDIVIGGRTMRVLAKRSGRLHRNHIRVIAGDRVRVELSPFDVTRGRIMYRFS